MAKKWKPSETQMQILANVRDHGEPTGSHGYPFGMSGHGGWSQSLAGLERRGLVTSEFGPWTEMPGGGKTRRRYYTLTEAAAEFIEMEP